MPCVSLTSCSLVVSVVGELGSAGAGPGLLGLCFPITQWSGGGTPAGHHWGAAWEASGEIKGLLLLESV